jgi:aryl-alcohol dehydrogenase-like predicted oxidoreductase
MRWHADRSIYRSLKAASLREEVDGSLRRLQVEAIDLYQIHWPNPEEEIEEGWETLSTVSRAGKGALDRRLEFQRRANGAHSEDRAHHQSAAALLHAASG